MKYPCKEIIKRNGRGGRNRREREGERETYRNSVLSRVDIGGEVGEVVGVRDESSAVACAGSVVAVLVNYNKIKSIK